MIRRRTILPLIFVACTIAGLPVTASAQRALTLDEVLSRALRENPDVRAARARRSEAHAYVTASRAYPNPSFNLAPGTPTQYIVSVSFDVGPQRYYRQRTAALAANATEFDVSDNERQLRFSVRQ